MILVVLGTQDMAFPRLIKMVETAVEQGVIKDKVIVQSGHTKYESSKLMIFDFCSMESFDQVVSHSDLIITHGGVGTILQSIINNKKVIAVPRLEVYKEHENDHQVEICKEFSDLGYIKTCNCYMELKSCLETIDEFHPKKYISNNEKFCNKLMDIIGED